MIFKSLKLLVLTNMAKIALSVIVFVVFSLFSFSQSLPLSTKGRWIVDDQSGQRVKLTCVNLVSHAQSMVAQGVDKRPLNEIAAEIAKRFNCVRLTYSIHMFTRYSNQLIGDIFDDLDLGSAKSGVQNNNPDLLNMTVVEAFGKVVDELGSQGLMIELDNHISQPRWCCSLNDGNGFFGDRHFDPREWLRGLAFVAGKFSHKPNVVGMSLRNELRGELSNTKVWFKYVTIGSYMIHSINPNLLVVVSGLNYDNDLSYLKQTPLTFNLNNKLVLEAHLYSFSGDPQSKFVNQPLNSICDKIMKKFEREAGFVVEGNRPFPLYLSEFGFDQTGKNEADNRFMSCFLARIAKKDIDWALWAFQGSYIYRQGQEDAHETFGVMDSTWTKDRYPKLAQMLQLSKRMNQDPNSNAPVSYIMHHTESGHCVKFDGNNGIKLSDCNTASQWGFGGDGSQMKLMSHGLCLKAVGDGKAALVSSDCTGEQSNWSVASKSELHLSTTDENGEKMCLELESDSSIVTKKCICVEDDPTCLDDPQSQWFNLVPTNVA